MNIILASAELTPFAKAGGLADIAASLPLEWKKYEQNPIIILPKYSFIDTEYYNFKPTDLILYVPISNWIEFARLWFGSLPNSNVPVYLIENKDYFDRAGIYGEPYEYLDNDRRFIFFSRAVFEVANALSFTPDIIHAHDFHTAMTMAFLKSQYRYSSLFSRCAGVYTIHNLAHQGWFNPQRAMAFSTFGMDQFYPGSWFEHRNWFNAMKAGIMFADKITTVSPTYANEIRSAYYGEGLQDVLNLRAADLIGILNGVYYEDWNPEIDKYLFTNYSSNTLELKRVNKIHFLKEWGLDDKDNLDLPLIGMVSRLAEQKGIDILLYKLEEYIANNSFRFVLLGSGEKHYEDYFRYLNWKYPGKVIVNIGYNNAIAHKIIASSDFIFLPSRYEPCGLTQMYALKYGTIPIVRQTGGLADTVKEYNAETSLGNGFVFLHYYPDDFAYAIKRALSIYMVEPHWNAIRKNAMAEDFSSSRTALEYLKVFKWALEKVRA